MASKAFSGIACKPLKAKEINCNDVNPANGKMNITKYFNSKKRILEIMKSVEKLHTYSILNRRVETLFVKWASSELKCKFHATLLLPTKQNFTKSCIAQSFTDFSAQ